MKDVKIVAEPYPPRAWIDTVEQGVDNHNVAVTGLADFYWVNFFLRGNSGQVLGGLLGDIWGGWLHVGTLWVDRSIRGRGYGTQLMARAEHYGREKSCTDSFLQTASFEARPLYEKLGYRVYGELKNHPIKPHGRFFLSKSLVSGPEIHPHITELQIVMDPYAPTHLQVVLREGIYVHASAAIGLPENAGSPVGFFLRDSAGEVMGGATGNIWGDWLYIAYLWVDKALRGRGYATQLMHAAEEYALAKHCTDAFLDTFSFQARPLYERLGYHVFAQEKDHPKGHSRYLLTKRLPTRS